MRRVNPYEAPWVIECNHPEDPPHKWRRAAGFGGLPAFATRIEDGLAYLKEWQRSFTGEFRLRNTRTQDIIMGSIL